LGILFAQVLLSNPSDADERGTPVSRALDAAVVALAKALGEALQLVAWKATSRTHLGTQKKAQAKTPRIAQAVAQLLVICVAAARRPFVTLLPATAQALLNAALHLIETGIR
jgi:hypothetical protein